MKHICETYLRNISAKTMDNIYELKVDIKVIGYGRDITQILHKYYTKY